MATLRATSALLALLMSSVLATPAVAAPWMPVEPDGDWPLRPRPEVVRGFDPPAVPWGPGHRGVDLTGHLGQSVHAALAGRVSYAGRVAGLAVVVVDHGDTRTTYQPVAALVSVGDLVERGQRIGRLAFFGSHCLPRTCLHWGLIRGVATYLDPLDLVGGPRPVRLLPIDGGRVLRRGPMLESPGRGVSGRASAGSSGVPFPDARRPGAAAPPLAARALAATVALGIAAVPHPSAAEALDGVFRVLASRVRPGDGPGGRRPGAARR